MEGSCCSFFIKRFCQSPDKRFVGQRFCFCLLWKGLILTLTNVYWDEAPMLYLDLIYNISLKSNVQLMSPEYKESAVSVKLQAWLLGDIKIRN